MMMVNEDYKTGDTVAVKLVTGEEFIGRLVAREGTGIVISNPLTMGLEVHQEVMADPQTGQPLVDPQTQQPRLMERPHVVFAPFMLGMPENAKIKIGMNQVIAVVKAREDAAIQYGNIVKQGTGYPVA
jgi:hypothetical protein